jgi:ADP-ribose pyrophosphatase YjhB (NUDIX family)
MSCLAVNQAKELLLIKRGIEPMAGSWALPGGFIELEECPEHAGQRELLEETGLRGEPGRLISVLSHMSPLYGPLIMIGYEYIIGDENPVAGDDAQDAGFFPFDDLPEIPFRAHRILIEQFRKILGL